MPQRLAATLLILATTAHASGIVRDIPDSARQLVLVTADSWASPNATVQCYERSGGKWERTGSACAAQVGERGLAWGLGLHRAPSDAAPRKREGDRRAPAGIFRITGAFGTLPRSGTGAIRLPYLALTGTHEAIDDPASRQYNRIVDRATAARPDWRSSERMAASPHYILGLTIGHNPAHVPGAGSCIFLHAWIGERTGSPGCTLLHLPDLLRLARWLDPARHPVLVQLPRSEARGF